MHLDATDKNKLWSIPMSFYESKHKQLIISTKINLNISF